MRYQKGNESKEQSAYCMVGNIKKLEGRILTLLDASFEDKDKLIALKNLVKREFSLSMSYATGFFGQVPPPNPQFEGTSETTREALLTY
jgi:hypothetical protein